MPGPGLGASHALPHVPQLDTRPRLIQHLLGVTHVEVERNEIKVLTPNPEFLLFKILLKYS